jgi:HTH-type transcriptional regulator/antitoxin HigA
MSTTTDTPRPAEAFPPGEYLRDELEARAWTESEFAQIIGRPVQAVSEILNGRKEITPETAVAFGEALGTSPDLWLNLQSTYRLLQLRQERVDFTPVKRRARLRELVPVTELRKRGWLADSDDLDLLEASVCELLELESIGDSPKFAAAARRANSRDKRTPQQTAWLARVRQRAARRRLVPFDAGLLETLAATLPRVVRDPVDLGHLEGRLGDCGVALVVELPLRSSKIDGAVMLLPGGNPAIGLSTRGDRFDGFLFTLLHEIAHLALGHLDADGYRIDEDLMSGADVSDIEAAANERASSWIFPSGFDVPGRLSKATILQAAEAYGVHPSLVVGRLQRDERLGWDQLRGLIPKVRPFVDLAG